MKACPLRTPLFLGALILAHAAFAEDTTPSLWVVEDRRHTEIALPLKEIPEEFARFGGASDKEGYLLIGFGERDYFRRADNDIDDAAMAMLSGAGTIRFKIYHEPPQSFYGAEHAVLLPLSAKGLETLISYVGGLLRKGEDGRPLRIASPDYPQNFYYETTSRYSMFHNCNTWTAEVLREADLAIDPSGVLFESDVMRLARKAAKPRIN